MKLVGGDWSRGDLIALVGLFVAIIALYPAWYPLFRVGTADREARVADYLSKVMSVPMPSDRGGLIEAADRALPPDDAVSVAIRFAYPNKNPGNNEVAKAAISVLRRLNKNGRAQLRRIATEGRIPESEIAAAVLGERTLLLVRVSDVDDFGRLVKLRKTRP